MNQLTKVALLALFLTACKSTPMTPAKVEDTSSKPATTSTAPVMTDDSADKSAIKTVEVESKDLGLDAPELAKRQVFFDYDSDLIKEEYKGVIASHAKYLAAHPSAKVVLQGNTDERGTREYNVSLGQRRSVAVKKSLNLLGVADSQIETVSYGEERATQNCKDDSCYQNDRRVDLVYAQ